jgi:POT family proton-dependent oligopeptide transporter
MTNSLDRTVAPPPAPPSETANRWPPQIKFIIGNEACERFSYYGIRGILALYISQTLFSSLASGKAMDRATEIIHYFVFANYFLALPGAWLSDKLLGRYNTILYVSLVYCLGNLVLALTVGSPVGLLVGLGLIALGSGGIKPCVSAFCGDQFKAEQSKLLQKAYGLFYWSINFGSFFGFLVIPWLREHKGYRIAFGVPGIFMLIATIIFWSGRKYYMRVPPTTQTKSAGFMRVTWYALSHLGHRKSGQSMWDVARERFTAREVDAARSVGPILAVFAPICIFWSLFDQTSSTWVMQGNKMANCEVLVNLAKQALSAIHITDVTASKIASAFIISAEQMQSTNALLVMILVPLMLWLYPRIEKLTGMRVSPLRRMGAGLVLGAVSYVIVGLLQTRVDAGAQLSVLWQTIPYILLTTGEVLLSTTGLEFAFTQAAAEMKSTIMSFWLLTVAFGNLFVPVLTSFKGHLLGTASESASVSASTFYLYAGLTLGVAIVFALIAMRYKERELELTSSM